MRYTNQYELVKTIYNETVWYSLNCFSAYYLLEKLLRECGNDVLIISTVHQEINPAQSWETNLKHIKYLLYCLEYYHVSVGDWSGNANIYSDYAISQQDVNRSISREMLLQYTDDAVCAELFQFIDPRVNKRLQEIEKEKKKAQAEQAKREVEESLPPILRPFYTWLTTPGGAHQFTGLQKLILCLIIGGFVVFPILRFFFK